MILIPIRMIPYRALVDQQIIVHEHQDNVREILFKTRRMIKATSGPGRQLVLTFIDVVDLYEQTMATHHDYGLIREQYGKTGCWPSFINLYNTWLTNWTI